jgi:hypothetical protein
MIDIKGAMTLQSSLVRTLLPSFSSVHATLRLPSAVQGHWSRAAQLAPQQFLAFPPITLQYPGMQSHGTAIEPGRNRARSTS